MRTHLNATTIVVASSILALSGWKDNLMENVLAERISCCPFKNM